MSRLLSGGDMKKTKNDGNMQTAYVELCTVCLFTNVFYAGKKSDLENKNIDI
jgi:hypothetical protein